MKNSAVFFGAKNIYYEENAKIQQNVVEETVKFAADCVSPTKNGLWLDLGSGTGLVCKKLCEKFPEIKIVSSDISPAPLLKTANSVCCDFDNLAFADGSFDNIISCSALQWSQNIENLIQNSMRILKLNGKLIVAVFGAGTLENLSALQKKYGIKSLVSFYEGQYLEEILQKSGFKIIAKQEKIFSQSFAKAYEALKSISKIGATNHGGKILSPKILRNFVKEYETVFNGGEIIHDYKTFFYISEKI